MAAMPAFIIGCLAWFYMIHTLWAGEGAQAKNASGNAAVQTAYNTMMWIIIVGWAVYPVGYFMGYLAGGVDEGALNLIYNLADFINKILFGIVIWSAAVSDSNK
jgi:bacteriorhodopsin